MKSAVFDIETSALEGIGAGLLLCVCVRPLSTKRTRTLRLDDSKFDPDPLFGMLEREEKALLEASIAELEHYDLVIGHNIDNFDLGFLQTRALRHGIEWRYHPITYDTMKAFRRTKLRTLMNGYGKPTASMAMVADLLGVTQEKTLIYPATHWLSIWGNDLQRIETMNQVADHCQRDVRMNSGIYEILLPMDQKVSLKRWM